jgi:CHASE3 domain sensor protein
MKIASQSAFRSIYASAFALFLISGAMVYRSTGHLLQINRLLEHSHEVLVKLESLQIALDEGVSSTRNYVVTGDPSNLDRFANAKRDLADLVRSAHPIISDALVYQRHCRYKSQNQL